MKKTLLAQRKEDDEEWLRDNILYSSCSILEKVCQLLMVSLEGVKETWAQNRGAPSSIQVVMA
jgi:hypothetical protein